MTATTTTTRAFLLLLVSAILCVTCVNGLRGERRRDRESNDEEWERSLKNTFSPTFAPTDDVGGGGGGDNDLTLCFSAGATVQALGEGAVPMKDLRVGDKVLTGNGKYSPIYSFAHFAPEKIGDFLQIRTKPKEGSSSSAPLEISKEHMLFLKDHDVPIRADEVKVGDVLLDHSTGAGATVTKIKKLSKNGLFAPLVADGTVVVDDLVSSCYTDLQQQRGEDVNEVPTATTTTTITRRIPFGLSQHDYVHWGLSPWRLVCRLGGPELLCNTYNQDGYPHYVAFALKINQFAASHDGSIVEYLILSLILFATGMIHLMEYVLFDASWILSLCVALCMMIIIMRRRSLDKAT